MATSTINNPHSPISVIASSSGSKKIKEHLAALKSAYFGLSNSFKKKAVIIQNSSSIYSICNSNDGIFAYFGANEAGNKFTAVSIRLQANNSATDPVYLVTSLTNNGSVEVANNAENTSSDTFELAVM